MQLKVVGYFQSGLQDIDKITELYLNQYSTKLLGSATITLQIYSD